jgi:hypothetical protein
MDPTVKAVLFLVAVILFVIDSFVRAVMPVRLTPLGLAFFAFPFMWDAFEVA